MEVMLENLRNAVSGLHKTLRRSFSKEQSFSLTELETLGLIYRTEQILPSELAAKTKITMPSMSQVLKKMEQLGLILRTPSAEDGRKISISLTEHGRLMVETARSSKDEKLQELIQTRLTPEEIALLKKAIPVLRKLTDV